MQVVKILVLLGLYFSNEIILEKRQFRGNYQVTIHEHDVDNDGLNNPWEVNSIMSFDSRAYALEESYQIHLISTKTQIHIQNWNFPSWMHSIILGILANNSFNSKAGTQFSQSNLFTKSLHLSMGI